MTVNTTTSRVSYAGNGSTTTFSVPFYFLAAADLVVIRTASNGVQTTLVLNTDYTVTGAGNPAGGSVVCTTAPASATSLVIFRDPAATQLTDYQANDPFPAETHERALDKLTMVAQRLKDLSSRSLTLSDGDTTTISTQLPSPEASKLIGWNTTNTGLQNFDTADLFSAAVYANWVYDVFTGDGATTSYTLQKSPGSIANMDVAVGGVTQLPGTDYTLSGATLTFTTAPPNGDKILARYGQAAEQVSSTFSIETMTATASQTVFNLTSASYAPGTNNLAVYVNGLRLIAGVDYVETDSNTVTTTSGLAAGDEVQFVCGRTLNDAVGAESVSFLQAGTGAVARTAQAKMRDVVNATDFGAVADFTTNNTAAVQSAINSLGTYGGTVYIKDGSKFNLKSLTLPARCNIDYRVDDDTGSSGQGSVIASSERVLFSSNSSYPADPTGGIVNEWRFTAPFHPGVVVDVRKDVTSAATYLGPGQSMTAPVRASYNIIDEESVGRWSLLYQNYDTWSNFSGLYNKNFRPVVTLNGIGTAQWASVPSANTVITGTTSGAKGFLLSVAAGATTVLWFSGKFVAGETLSDNNETTTATVSSVSFANGAMQWLAQDFKRGNWSIGLPPGVPTHLFAVGGKIAVTKSRTSGQYIDDTITNPAYVWVDDYEVGTPNGFEVTYNVTPAAASRRLTLRNLGSTADRAHIGAVHAHCQFSDAGAISTSAYNIASFTKNGTGDYTLTFTNAAARADFSTVVATQDPLQYAYVYVYTTSVVRIRVVTTGTSTLVNATGYIHLQCMGGDI